MSGIVGKNVGRGSGVVTATPVGADAVSGANIADDAIDSEHYTDGSIDNAHIADNAIDSEHYADGSIDNAHIADDAIDSEHYADGSIDNAHIADDAIDSEHYAAGSIDEAHIADNAVSLAKMAGNTDGVIITFNASGDPVAVGPGSDGQVLTSTGAGSPPAFEAAAGGAFETGCRVELSSNQTGIVTATWTKVTLDTEIYDLGSDFASNKFTVPTTGEYLVCGTIGYDSNVDEKRYQAAIYKNGSVVGFSSHASGGTNKSFVTISGVFQATASQYFELFGYHNIGSDNAFEGGTSGSQMSVHRLS